MISGLDSFIRGHGLILFYYCTWRQLMVWWHSEARRNYAALRTPATGLKRVRMSIAPVVLFLWKSRNHFLEISALMKIICRGGNKVSCYVNKTSCYETILHAFEIMCTYGDYSLVHGNLKLWTYMFQSHCACQCLCCQRMTLLMGLICYRLFREALLFLSK